MNQIIKTIIGIAIPFVVMINMIIIGLMLMSCLCHEDDSICAEKCEDRFIVTSVASLFALFLNTFIITGLVAISLEDDEK